MITELDKLINKIGLEILSPVAGEILTKQDLDKILAYMMGIQESQYREQCEIGQISKINNKINNKIN